MISPIVNVCAAVAHELSAMRLGSAISSTMSTTRNHAGRRQRRVSAPTISQRRRCTRRCATTRTDSSATSARTSGASRRAQSDCTWWVCPLSELLHAPDDVRRLVDALVADDVTAVGRRPHLTAAGVDADVVDATGAGEEDQVTRKLGRRRDVPGLAVLRRGVVREMDPELTEDVHGEAGAVEGARPGGAVLVGRALVPCGLLQHPLSKAVGAWPGPRRRQPLDRRNRRCRLVL